MASAVENASVLLVGVSKSYQESANCRLEFEHAHQRKVSIIPIMTEKDFIPSGWLGLLLGMKLWFPYWAPEHETSTPPQLVSEIERLSPVVPPFPLSPFPLFPFSPFPLFPFSPFPL